MANLLQRMQLFSTVQMLQMHTLMTMLQQIRSPHSKEQLPATQVGSNLLVCCFQWASHLGGYAPVVGPEDDIESLRSTIYSYFNDDASIPDSGTPYSSYSGALHCLSDGTGDAAR